MKKESSIWPITGCLLTVLLHLTWSAFTVQLVLSFIIKPAMPWPKETKTYIMQRGNDYEGYQLNSDGTLSYFYYEKMSSKNDGYGYSRRFRVDSQKYYQMLYPIHKHSSLSNPTRIVTKNWMMLESSETAYHFDISEYDSHSHNGKMMKKEQIDAYMQVIFGGDYLKYGDKTYTLQKLPNWMKTQLKL